MTTRSVITVGILVMLDQLTKFMVSAKLPLHESVPVVSGLLHITKVHNSGMAFGLFKGMILVFVFLSIVTIFLIILYARRFRATHRHLRTGLLLLLAGTIGNLIDRVRLGYVIDFIDLRIWPVFNIADITITIGGAFLVYHIIIMSRDHRQV